VYIVRDACVSIGECATQDSFMDFCRRVQTHITALSLIPGNAVYSIDAIMSEIMTPDYDKYDYSKLYLGACQIAEHSMGYVIKLPQPVNKYDLMNTGLSGKIIIATSLPYVFCNNPITFEFLVKNYGVK